MDVVAKPVDWTDALVHDCPLEYPPLDDTQRDDYQAVWAHRETERELINIDGVVGSVPKYLFCFEPTPAKKVLCMSNSTAIQTYSILLLIYSVVQIVSLFFNFGVIITGEHTWWRVLLTVVMALVSLLAGSSGFSGASRGCLTDLLCFYNFLIIDWGTYCVDLALEAYYIVDRPLVDEPMVHIIGLPLKKLLQLHCLMIIVRTILSTYLTFITWSLMVTLNKSLTERCLNTRPSLNLPMQPLPPVQQNVLQLLKYDSDINININNNINTYDDNIYENINGNGMDYTDDDACMSDGVSLITADDFGDGERDGERDGGAHYEQRGRAVGVARETTVTD
eukprot:GHVR01116358.1.p1 GENE.GHVR01116358.1~~GHVR01116358.1.p1  ORF type:complete len:336 (-),score=81.52 GHVR01116358.1:88-1095(-)